MKHTTNLINGYYTSKNHNHYRVIVDKYSGNNYRVVAVYEDYMTHLIGRTLTNGHDFRRAVKKEQEQFKLHTADRHGNQIEPAADLLDAIQLIKTYEAEDIVDGTYSENFYEVEDKNNCRVYY